MSDSDAGKVFIGGVCIGRVTKWEPRGKKLFGDIVDLEPISPDDPPGKVGNIVIERPVPLFVPGDVVLVDCELKYVRRVPKKDE